MGTATVKASGIFRAALVLAACLGSGTTWCGTRPEDEGLEPITRPSGLSAVRWVVIEENAATATAAAPGVDCSKFVLTPQGVARYLANARRIDEYDFNHMVTWLPCYAAGHVGFTDGRRAVWSVREDGAAWLQFDDASEVFLYCPRCRLPRTGSWLVN